jgi:tryptophanyl-tRNA synthetase
VFEFHRQYSDPEQVAQIAPQCRKAEIGCVECKKQMAVGLNAALATVREKRAYYEERPELVADIIEKGNARAREVAQATMVEVRKAIKI